MCIACVRGSFSLIPVSRYMPTTITCDVPLSPSLHLSIPVSRYMSLLLRTAVVLLLHLSETLCLAELLNFCSSARTVVARRSSYRKDHVTAAEPLCWLFCHVVDDLPLIRTVAVLRSTARRARRLSLLSIFYDLLCCSALGPRVCSSQAVVAQHDSRRHILLSKTNKPQYST